MTYYFVVPEIHTNEDIITEFKSFDHVELYTSLH